MKWTFEARASAPTKRGACGVFEESRFGAHDRIAWPKGACEPATTHRAFGGRLAVIADEGALFVLDAEREAMLRVSVSGIDFVPIDAGARGATACVGVADGAISIPFAELGALPDEGRSDLELEVIYPERQATRRVRARVVWVMRDELLINVQEDPVWQMKIPRSLLDLDRAQEFELVDELWPKTFAYAEVGGRSITLHQPRDTMRGSLTWRRVRAKDPAEGATDNITAIGTRGDAAQLLAQVVEEPSDLDARPFLIDALGEAGEACAETFALLAAGKPVGAARQRAALGPAGHFLCKLEFRGGLPWAAAMRRETPTVPEVIEAALADVRFGMFETLRVADGPKDVFEQLIATRVLPGLRRVDVVSLAMLRKLKKLGYDKLVQLWRVPVTGSATFELLADRTFAQVTDIELHVERSRLTKRVDAILDGARALRGRHVTVDSDGWSELQLAQRLFAKELPCATLTISGVTVAADGAVTVHATHAREVARVARELRAKR